MFTVKINEVEYKVTFNHYMKDTIHWVDGIMKIDQRPATECAIHNLTYPGVPEFGETSTHYKDHYCRNTGRKIALQDALLNGCFTKAERALFWKAYFEKCPEPKSPAVKIKELKEKITDLENALSLFGDGKWFDSEPEVENVIPNP